MGMVCSFSCIMILHTNSCLIMVYIQILTLKKSITWMFKGLLTFWINRENCSFTIKKIKIKITRKYNLPNTGACIVCLHSVLSFGLLLNTLATYARAQNGDTWTQSFVLNTQRCSVKTSGSKAAHELVEQAGGALQQASCDTPHPSGNTAVFARQVLATQQAKAWNVHVPLINASHNEAKSRSHEAASS